MTSMQYNTLQPKVAIPQGIIIGSILRNGLKNEVEAFRGIPYALPPTGERRFRRPVKVDKSSNIIYATEFGPSSPGKPLLPGSPKLEYSEDCLTVNVFRQIPQTDRLYPVAIYVHGGAFNRGTSSMHNTASMVSWSEEPFIAVSFNYRLGALGFLPSRLTAKEGVLNLGLWDQVLLFEWVQENIGAFGGDKNDVTLVGLSAGAHSIGHHMMRHNDNNPGPFHRVIIESGSVTSRAVRKHDAEIHEQQFRDFLRNVGCPSNTPEASIFSYLRTVPLERITQAQTAVFDQYNPSLRWAFQPVIDGELIPQAPIEIWRSNNYYKIPMITGFTTNEGSLYVDKQMATGGQFVNFFRRLLPQLSDEDIDLIDKLYPDPESSADKTYKVGQDLPDVGSQYKRIETAYGQYAYVAPVRQSAHLASSRQTALVYLYHWAPRSSVLGGAGHGENMKYETFNEEIVSRSQSQRELAGTMHAYMTNFICHKGNPNMLAGEWRDRPKWEPYQPGNPRAMIFGKGNEELIGGEAGVTAEMVNDEWARRECEFWWDRVELSQQ